MQEARYWHREEDGLIGCDLCPHGCRIAEGKQGRCRVRGVHGGLLEALAYGCLSSANVDPIEKKPLYHFRPGSSIFSIGGWGCNFRCEFCQNWQISQQFVDDSRRVIPAEIVARAANSGSDSIAYTYNEPLVNFEFVLDCAAEAREKGLINVLVTNGYIRREPAAELLKYIGALNVDIKSTDDSFYVKYCGGTLAPVLSFALQARAAGCHVEATNLLIPGANDSDAGILSLARWIRANLGEETPLHLSAYFPRYKCEIEATPLSLLEHAYALCRTELMHVYLGNVHKGKNGCDTTCAACGSLLIERHGYSVRIAGVSGGKCAQCGRMTDVVW